MLADNLLDGCGEREFHAYLGGLVLKWQDADGLGIRRYVGRPPRESVAARRQNTEESCQDPKSLAHV